MTEALIIEAQLDASGVPAIEQPAAAVRKVGHDAREPGTPEREPVEFCDSESSVACYCTVKCSSMCGSGVRVRKFETQ